MMRGALSAACDSAAAAEAAAVGVAWTSFAARMLLDRPALPLTCLKGLGLQIKARGSCIDRNHALGSEIQHPSSSILRL